MVNPSECCSLPHGHTFSSIFCCVLAVPLERVLLAPWGVCLAPLSLGFPPGLSTPFPCSSFFLSLIGSLGSLRSGVYSFIKSLYPLLSLVSFSEMFLHQGLDLLHWTPDFSNFPKIICRFVFSFSRRFGFSSLKNLKFPFCVSIFLLSSCCSSEYALSVWWVWSLSSLQRATEGSCPLHAVCTLRGHVYYLSVGFDIWPLTSCCQFSSRPGNALFFQI